MTNSPMSRKLRSKMPSKPKRSPEPRQKLPGEMPNLPRRRIDLKLN